ncbi:MAG: hypothetical protein CL609_03480 [Anaerolineaceae bacterium]|nr:hypothetical protein [Anaerolineaceae bacterium]
MRKILPVLGISLIYALCYTAIKLGLKYSPPLIFGGLRALIGGLALLGILLTLRQPILLDRRDLGIVFLIGLISTTINFGAMFLSPGFTNAGIASVLGNLQPLAALLLAAIFLGERLIISKIAALLFGTAGVILIAFPAFSGRSVYGINGSLLALSASISSAIGSILVKKYILKTNLLRFAAWQLIFGSMPLLAVSVIFEPVRIIEWTPVFLGLLLFLAIVGTTVVTAVWYWLLRKQEVGYLTQFLFLTPLFGLGIAALVFNERLSLLASTGVIFILVGITIVARNPKKHSQADQMKHF